jgi:Coatomer (COPI) alpha subunit C-terminus
MRAGEEGAVAGLDDGDLEGAGWGDDIDLDVGDRDDDEDLVMVNGDGDGDDDEEGGWDMEVRAPIACVEYL